VVLSEFVNSILKISLWSSRIRKPVKKVLFVTNFSAEKKKARLLYEIKLLEEVGYDVEVEYFEGDSTFFESLLTYASLKFFNFHQIFVVKRRARQFDHVVIYGMQLLPSVLWVPRSKMIYQTLDDNVSYTLYELGSRFAPFKWVSRPLDFLFRQIEKSISKKADFLLVNSKALFEYLPNAILNYYTSPFEGLKLNYQEEKPFVLLYLGQLRKEKGTLHLKELAERYSLDVHVFGISVDTDTDDFIKNDYVKFHGNKSISELKTELPKLSQKVNLIGVSLIESVHHSYATQEANKDIDYMAMGIPFVGNDRLPTKVKIDLGCGYPLNQFDKLLNFKKYKQASDKALEVYMKDFSNEKFERTFLNCFK